MTDQQRATPEAWVVAFEARRAASVSRALAVIGAVEPIGTRGCVVFRPKSPQKDARTAWSDLLRRNPDISWAAPVLRDSEGHELYPTGSLTVRFRDRPTAAAVKAFAAAHDLELESRNEFVAEQLCFTSRDPRATYLPELVAHIAARPDVAAAWASTESTYRRVE